MSSWTTLTDRCLSPKVLRMHRIDKFQKAVSPTAIELHVAWQEDQRAKGTTSYLAFTLDDAWVKKNARDDNMIDLLELSYGQLPIDWRLEYQDDARSCVNYYGKQSNIMAITPEQQFERCCVAVYRGRVQRAKFPYLNLPFAQLPDEDRQSVERTVTTFLKNLNQIYGEIP